MLIPRNLKPALLAAAKDTPVIMLNGARQTGKSTLMQGLFTSSSAPEYLSMDDLGTLDRALTSPQSFIESLSEYVIIDEIQRAPELLLPIKRSVDLNRRPGRFFLTGSANILSLPKVADSLAGRIEIHTLWPLSQGEIAGVKESFIDAAFSNKKLAVGKGIKIAKLVELMNTGGYPDAVKRDSYTRRKTWFASYLTTLIEKDVRDIKNVQQLTIMPKLLQLLASRSGGLLNSSDLSRSLEMQLSTLKTYLSILELLFLIVPLQPWFGNIGKRLVKSPKMYINDTGLLCHLLSRDAKALLSDGSLLGMVFENFVIMELIKQISWSKLKPRIYHFRTENRQEVDVVLEAPDGSIVGIECKASSSFSSDAFIGLKTLKELTGKKFHRGIVFYTGPNVLGAEKDIQAVPISALWETSNEAAPALTE